MVFAYFITRNTPIIIWARKGAGAKIWRNSSLFPIVFHRLQWALQAAIEKAELRSSLLAKYETDGCSHCSTITRRFFNDPCKRKIKKISYKMKTSENWLKARFSLYTKLYLTKKHHETMHCPKKSRTLAMQNSYSRSSSSEFEKVSSRRFVDFSEHQLSSLSFHSFGKLWNLSPLNT